MSRWFLRCPDCLSVAAIDAPKPPHGTICAVCNVGFELMGRVVRERIVIDAERCACDERCTCASGPSCSCRCGGENHGSGAVVQIQIDAGGIPRATPPDGRAAIRRDEWRAALERAKEQGPGRHQAARKRAGEYLGAQDFARYLEHQDWTRRINHARGLRTHHGRMAAISKIAGPPPAVEYRPPAWSEPAEGKPPTRRAVAVGQQVGLLG